MLRVFLIISSLILPSYCSFNPNNDVIVSVQKLSIGEVKQLTLNSTLEYVLVVENMTCSLALSPPRISLLCPDCEEESPLLVAIRQRKGILSWELPLVEDPIDKEAFLHANRTLCPFDIIESNSSCQDETSQLMIDLSTSSTKNISAQVSLELEQEFVLSLRSPKNISVSPASPRYLVFQFKDTNATSVLLHVGSTSDICMTVSVQHIKCPVNDGEANVQRAGYFQSVTQSSGITIQRDEYPDGFYAVFVVHATNRICGRSFLERGSRVKEVSVVLEETITPMDYAFAILITLSVLFGLSLLIIIVMVFYFRNLKYYYPEASGSQENGDSQSAIAAIQSLTASVVTTPRSEHSLINDNISNDSSIDEIDIDMLQDIETDKNLWRSKSVLTVCDLSRKMPSVLGKKSELYLWYLLTVSVFYFLPVVQLVITYQRMIYMTGNQNVCYFNFLCAHPWGISDFNHVFSNIGYAVMGLLFIGITRYRQKIHFEMVQRNKAIDRCYGIPQHFGIFYAMGAALTVEGVLSGCYHVCPNSYNFQFDTSFMYVISTLCMLKLYHTRHPDISASAYATFATLALAILFGMCGVLSGTPSFWSIFTFIHLSSCFLISLQIYYLGRWRYRSFSIFRITRVLYTTIRLRQFRAFLPTYISRFVIILIANLVNWALAVLGPMYVIGQFATYLLAIFMVNLILYTFFYISMKIYNKEKIGRTPWVLIAVSCLTWAGSLYFFFNKSISWKLTPAESKLFNQQCLVFGFYDNHDLWHFLSAASMFLSFMVLLTLDDAVLSVPREQIAVF